MKSIGKFIFPLLVATFTEIGVGQGQLFLEDPRPVFMIHGLFAGGLNLEYMASRIRKSNPRRVVYVTYADRHLSSLTPLQAQISGDLGQEFRNFSDSYPGGFHLIGHSQGALLCRVLVESYPEHNVHHVISISGPQGGQFGVPTLTPRPWGSSAGNALQGLSSLLALNPSGQGWTSISDLWHDPFNEQLYFSRNRFLPYYDNQIQTQWSQYYKQSFIKLRRFVAILGPDDEIIKPWQSGDFSFYDQFGRVANYTQRDIYTKDLFGLRTLDEQGKFIKFIISGVRHLEWVINNEVIDKFIIPNLD